jgi:hypothetical protein
VHNVSFVFDGEGFAITFHVRYATGRSLAMGPYPTIAKRTCNWLMARVALIPLRSNLTKMNGVSRTCRSYGFWGLRLGSSKTGGTALAKINLARMESGIGVSAGILVEAT